MITGEDIHVDVEPAYLGQDADGTVTFSATRSRS